MTDLARLERIVANTAVPERDAAWARARLIALRTTGGTSLPAADSRRAFVIYMDAMDSCWRWMFE